MGEAKDWGVTKERQAKGGTPLTFGESSSKKGMKEKSRTWEQECFKCRMGDKDDKDACWWPWYPLIFFFCCLLCLWSLVLCTSISIACTWYFDAAHCSPPFFPPCPWYFWHPTNVNLFCILLSHSWMYFLTIGLFRILGLISSLDLFWRPLFFGMPFISLCLHDNDSACFVSCICIGKVADTSDPTSRFSIHNGTHNSRNIYCKIHRIAVTRTISLLRTLTRRPVQPVYISTVLTQTKAIRKSFRKYF